MKNYNLVLNDNMVKAIRNQARLILIPFFQKISLSIAENESGDSYPVLASLAERIINDVYQKGDLGFGSREKASKIAHEFVKKLHDWQKECLAFYFCTEDTLVEELEAEGPSSFFQGIHEDDWDKETGKVITESIQSMISIEELLASNVVTELVHLQDIFSTEDVSSWDASSIAYANENFMSYTNSEIKLISIPMENDFEYWDKIIDDTSDEDEDEDEEVDEDEDENYNPFF